MNSNMELNAAQVEALLKPYDFNLTELRQSDGQKIVPHEWVRARLTEIFGPTGWSEQILELREIDLGRDFGRNFKEAGYVAVAYTSQVRVTIRNPDGSLATFWDGAGAWGVERDDKSRIPIWEMHSDCRNGALSVAFLRATKNLGPQFGLSLYSQDRPSFNPRYYLPYESTYLPPEDGDGEQDGQQEMLAPDTGTPATAGDRPNDPT